MLVLLLFRREFRRGGGGGWNLSISLIWQLVKDFSIGENRFSITFLLSILLCVPNKKTCAIHLATGNALFRLNMYNSFTAVTVTAIYAFISIIHMCQAYMGRALSGLQKTKYKISSCSARTKFAKKLHIDLGTWTDRPDYVMHPRDGCSWPTLIYAQSITLSVF